LLSEKHLNSFTPGKISWILPKNSLVLKIANFRRKQNTMGGGEKITIISSKNTDGKKTF